nr:hypothetical protein [Burkholderia plantarii]
MHAFVVQLRVAMPVEQRIGQHARQRAHLDARDLLEHLARPRHPARGERDRLVAHRQPVLRPVGVAHAALAPAFQPAVFAAGPDVLHRLRIHLQMRFADPVDLEHRRVQPLALVADDLPFRGQRRETRELLERIERGPARRLGRVPAEGSGTIWHGEPFG